MKKDESNAMPTSEWDKQVCAHLDDLWNKHHSGEIEPVDMDVAFAKANAIIDRAIAEQRTERAKTYSRSLHRAV